MKICLVGPANSAHIIKWCKWFGTHGHEVHLISFTNEKVDYAIQHKLSINVDPQGSELQKLKYLFTGRQIREIINEIDPDIVNAHYATSYGIAMALSGVRGYLLSVWGSDIYAFPRKSILHRLLLQYSLNKASVLFSTSQAMADEAKQYTAKSFEITPFGVDMELFNPSQRTRASKKPFTIGTVKTLSDLYGIEYLIKSASIIKDKRPDIHFVMRIAGDGPKRKEYQQLISDLELSKDVILLGHISQEEAAKEWSNMDVAIIPSIEYESFGVSAVEAQACGTALIISDVDGLKESTVPGRTSIVVPKKDESAIADSVAILYNNDSLRNEMGLEGRRVAEEKYELNRCFERILLLYQEYLPGKHK